MVVVTHLSMSGIMTGMGHLAVIHFRGIAAWVMLVVFHSFFYLSFLRISSEIFSAYIP